MSAASDSLQNSCNITHTPTCISVFFELHRLSYSAPNFVPVNIAHVDGDGWMAPKLNDKDL